MPSLLEVRGLGFSRDHRALATGLDFVLQAGEVLRIEGHNGAGKTTLLRILAGLYSTYDGDIHFRGASRRAVVANALRAGSHFLGHSQGLKLSLTARENLSWLAALKGQCVSSDEMVSALARVGLQGYEDVPCRQMSAGQQRRVAIAKLFLVSAELWLLDEPFTALDKSAVANLEGWIGEFAAAGGAVIMTTHHDPERIPGLKSLRLGQAA